MTDQLFRYLSPVFFEEMDPNAHLHNARFAVHIEHATTAAVSCWLAEADCHGADVRYAVRHFVISFDAPVRPRDDLIIELARPRMGRTSAAWDFTCRRSTDQLTCATGIRTIVKIDGSGAAIPWPADLRAALVG
jgi:acyl-CoA thioesterase FadM